MVEETYGESPVRLFVFASETNIEQAPSTEAIPDDYLERPADSDVVGPIP